MASGQSIFFYFESFPPKPSKNLTRCGTETVQERRGPSIFTCKPPSQREQATWRMWSPVCKHSSNTEVSNCSWPSRGLLDFYRAIKTI